VTAISQATGPVPDGAPSSAQDEASVVAHRAGSAYTCPACRQQEPALSAGQPHLRVTTGGAPVVVALRVESVQANDAVAAHELLNASAVVSSAVATLQALWEDLSAEQRTHLLGRMASHASVVDKGLKALTLGRSPSP
jgi:hypothetical protein